MKYILFLFLSTILWTCSGNGSGAVDAAIEEIEMAGDQQPLPTPKRRRMDESASNIEGEKNQKVERKLIKTGTIEFETEDIAISRKQILDASAKYEGYVSADNEFESERRQTNRITIRVPSKDFDVFVAEATQGVTHFDQKRIDVKDVTEEFVDVEARLKAKKQLETRYLEILNKAKTVKEILEVERQLGQVRTEIESIEGRLRYLQNQTSLSTITFVIYESKTVIPKGENFVARFQEGFVNGWRNLMWFFVGLVNIWPFIILLGGGVYLLRRWLKRRRK